MLGRFAPADQLIAESGYDSVPAGNVLAGRVRESRLRNIENMLLEAPVLEAIVNSAEEKPGVEVEMARVAIGEVVPIPITAIEERMRLPLTAMFVLVANVVVPLNTESSCMVDEALAISPPETVRRADGAVFRSPPASVQRRGQVAELRECLCQ